MLKILKIIILTNFTLLLLKNINPDLKKRMTMVIIIGILWRLIHKKLTII